MCTHDALKPFLLLLVVASTASAFAFQGRLTAASAASCLDSSSWLRSARGDGRGRDDGDGATVVAALAERFLFADGDTGSVSGTCGVVSAAIGAAGHSSATGWADAAAAEGTSASVSCFAAGTRLASVAPQFW